MTPGLSLGNSGRKNSGMSYFYRIQPKLVGFNASEASEFNGTIAKSEMSIPLCQAALVPTAYSTEGSADIPQY